MERLKMREHKYKVCKKCGQRNIGINTDTKQEVCLTCLGTEFEEHTLNENDILICTYCKKHASVKDILEQWTEIPFLDTTTMTYYDGCRGWD
jgi:hypothetical protein